MDDPDDPEDDQDDDDHADDPDATTSSIHDGSPESLSEWSR
jgi:hypothetical protein